MTAESARQGVRAAVVGSRRESSKRLQQFDWLPTNWSWCRSERRRGLPETVLEVEGRLLPLRTNRRSLTPRPHRRRVYFSLQPRLFQGIESFALSVTA